MAKHAYLVLNFSYRSGIYIDYVSANYRLLFSNICKDKLLAYIDQLREEGWQLIRMHTWDDGSEEAYYFSKNEDARQQ